MLNHKLILALLCIIATFSSAGSTPTQTTDQNTKQQQTARSDKKSARLTKIMAQNRSTKESLVRKFGLKLRKPPETKGYAFPEPWQLSDVATIDDMSVTYVRAVDDTTGIITCYMILEYHVTSRGWARWSGGELHIQSETTPGNILDDWNVGTLPVGCGDNHAYHSARKDFRPDWYPLVNTGPNVELTTANWHHCGANRK